MYPVNGKARGGEPRKACCLSALPLKARGQSHSTMDSTGSQRPVLCPLCRVWKKTQDERGLNACILDSNPNGCPSLLYQSRANLVTLLKGQKPSWSSGFSQPKHFSAHSQRLCLCWVGSLESYRYLVYFQAPTLLYD